MNVFAALVPAYRRDRESARRRLTDPDAPVRRVARPWGVIEHARYGQGPATLILHGSGGGWDQGVDWAQRRLGPHRGVISVSRFGYLGSTLPDGATTSTQADAYAELLDELGIDRVDVVALSAGSMTGLRFAGRHHDRVRSLVLESPVLPTRKRPPLPPVSLTRALVHAEFLVWALTRSPWLVRLGAGVRPEELDDAGRQELRDINATAFPLTPRGPGTVFDRAVAYPELAGGLIPAEVVRAPTLVVNATEAQLVPRDDARAFVQRLPDGRLLDVPTGGHVLIGNVGYLRGVLDEWFRKAADAEP